MDQTPRNPSGSILYQTEDGRTRLQERLNGETVWLSLNQLADLFRRDKSFISKHRKNIFEEGSRTVGREQVTNLAKQAKKSTPKERNS